MKKITLTFSLFMIGLFSLQAQIVIDSIQTGPAYGNDVFYSLKTGTVSVVPNQNWQLGFSIGIFNVSVRTNAATGSSGVGSVVTYEKPGADTNQWANFDTSGFHAWQVLENSDEDWEMGALNQNANGTDDYGWGKYDAVSHAVIGHRLYLLAVNSGTSTVFKKVFVQSKVLGAWNVKVANLDGSETYTYTFGQSGGFSTRNFVYVNVLTNQFIDREPAKTDWDFMLTRYRAYQQGAGIYYPSTGILTNSGVKVAEARGLAVDAALLENFIGDTSNNISEIGADWKVLSGPTFKIVDSLCYFVKAKDGAFWKLNFLRFAGSSTGNTVFQKAKLTPATGLTTAMKTIPMALYPNPVQSELNVLVELENYGSIQITDLSGKQVMQKNIEGNQNFVHSFDVSGLSNGVYVVEVVSGNEKAVQKFVVTH